MNIYSRIVDAIDRRINAKIDARIQAHSVPSINWDNSGWSFKKPKAKKLPVADVAVKPRKHRGRNSLISIAANAAPAYRSNTQNSIAWGCIKGSIMLGDEMPRVELTRRVMVATDITYSNASSIVSQMIAKKHLKSRINAGKTT